MKTFDWLVRREYWEHRGGFLWTPVWVGGVMLILTLIGIISAEVIGARINVQVGIPWNSIAERLTAGDIAQAGIGLDIAYIAVAWVLCIPLFFVLFFYLLGALYDDRRDRSVLFWKSLPVTDMSTVLSKVAAAVLLAPIIAFLAASIAYIGLLLLVCGWALVHGINPMPAIGASHPIGLFWRMLLTIPVDALWALPTVGWLLFWSAFARSKPFLWAVLVPVLVYIANAWIGLLGGPSIDRDVLLKDVLFRLLLGIMPGAWLDDGAFTFTSTMRLGSGSNTLALDKLDPAVVYGLLAKPELWIGVVVGAALIAASIWLRRRRIETST